MPEAAVYLIAALMFGVVGYGHGWVRGYRIGLQNGRRLENSELVSLGRRSEVTRPLVPHPTLFDEEPR